MQLQDQVISLEQAKKLKELWFERDSLFTFSKPWLVYWVYRNDEIRHPQHLSDYRAYTASELMDILPEYIDDMFIYVGKVDWYYFVLYNNIVNKVLCNAIKKTNLAQALWDMLIYLLENNLLPNQDK